MPATSTEQNKIDVRLMQYQSDVDVAGSMHGRRGFHFVDVADAQNLHEDTGFYPRRPQCGRRRFFVLWKSRAINTCEEE